MLPGGGIAQEDDKMILQVIIRAVWLNRDSGWQAFPEEGGGTPRHGHSGQ